LCLFTRTLHVRRLEKLAVEFERVTEREIKWSLSKHLYEKLLQDETKLKPEAKIELSGKQ